MGRAYEMDGKEIIPNQPESYAGMCFKIAWRHSWERSQTVSAVLWILINATAWKWPWIVAYVSRGKITEINDWAIAACLFGGIIVLRLLLAPYWAWKEMMVDRDAQKHEVKNAIAEKEKLEDRLSSERIKFDIADTEGRALAEKQIKSLQIQLDEARLETEKARKLAEKAEIASRPKPLKARLRECLDSIDSRITPALRTQIVNYTGGVEVRRAEELVKLASEAEAPQYLMIKNVRGGSGMYSGDRQTSGEKIVEMVIYPSVMND